MPPSDQPPTHGNGTITGAVSRVAGQVIGSLAPQFLALLLVNVLFMAAFVWFVNARAEHSVQVITQLLSTCLSAAQPRGDTLPLRP